ncbi:hypothetical protein OC5_05680 [Vibrio cyclitrophicus ZF264]|nr:hypothetical protein OC5_05680 [Vibrio cyclitrophicus ZF264]OEE48428.1 hypothetical protein OAG_10420 [Vibrio cyclitrophicus FF75]
MQSFSKLFILSIKSTQDKMNIDTIEEWTERCRRARDGHYLNAEKLFFRSQILGYMLIYSTVFVTTFSFFGGELEGVIFLGIAKQHVLILIGALSAVISGVVTQARFGERAEMHRSSGARYANLVRNIEMIKFTAESRLIGEEELNQQLREVTVEWNNLSKDSLLTPHKDNAPKFWFPGLIGVIFAVIFFFLVR